MGMKVGHLGGKDELVPNTPLLRPLANELLGLPVSVEVGRVDKVTSKLVESVEQLKRALLVEASGHDVLPGVAEGHGTQAEGGDTDTGLRGKDSVSVELRDWLLSVEDTHFERFCLV